VIPIIKGFMLIIYKVI